MKSAIIGLQSALLVFGLVAAAQVQAQETSAPKTREQVRSELIQAQRSGETLLPGEAGQPQKPFRAQDTASPTAIVVTAPFTRQRGALIAAGERGQIVEVADWISTRARSDVIAEYVEAVRTGKVLVAGEIGLTRRELYPLSYPAERTQLASR